MGRGSESNAKFAKLPVRRFCLQIINTITEATRWAVFEPSDSTLAERVRGQVLTYLDCLNDLGAFANDSFIVQCDAGVSNRSESEEQGITILLVFHPVGCDEPISLTLQQTASGFRVGSTAFGLTVRQPAS
jgi:phage tail sheath protein FI